MKTAPLFRPLTGIRWREFALRSGYCPLCDGTRIFARLRDNEIGVRCLTCRATPITLSLVAVLRELSPDLASKKVYELSARGPLVRFLRKHCRDLTCSQYFEDIRPGERHNGILCQDVQNLTFGDNSFDICTSTEVFEHVPDDRAGFAELKRVLRPGGLLLCTVPLFPTAQTIERARLTDRGEVTLLRPATYHGDPIRSHARVLVFRDYGRDIVQRLVDQGFMDVCLRKPRRPLPFGHARRVVTTGTAA